MLLHLFFFNDTATTEIYTLSLHDALPIFHDPTEAMLEPGHAVRCGVVAHPVVPSPERSGRGPAASARGGQDGVRLLEEPHRVDRKSTRLNSSHANISYAVFCLKNKKRT